MPKSLEQLVQQIGRPGRDGKRAKCTVFAAAQDFMEAGHTPNSRALLGQFLEATTTCRWHTLSRLCGEDASFLVKDGCQKCDVCCDKSSARTFNFAQEVGFCVDLLYACDATCQQSAKSWRVLLDKAKEQGTPMRARYDAMPFTLRGKPKRGQNGTTQDENKFRAFLDHALVPAKLVSCERRAHVGPGGQDRGHAVYFLSVDGETMRKKLCVAPGVEAPSVMLPMPWHLDHAEYQQVQCMPPDSDEDDGEFFCMHCDKEVADEGDACCAGARCMQGLHASCGPAFLGGRCSPPYLTPWFCPDCKRDPNQCYLIRTILDEKMMPNQATNKLERHYLVRWEPCAQNGFNEKEETWEPGSNLHESHLDAFDKRRQAAATPPHGDTAPAPPSQPSAGASSSSR
jgi:hypothetical protein